MSKIIRYQFMGNWIVFTLLCLTGFGIPIAFLYALNSTVRIESELENPEELVYRYRVGALAVKQKP
jgi:hypothetical protein